MFKVNYLVDDRKLGDSLRALLGLAVGTPEATPVHGATVVKGEVREVTEAPLLNRAPTVRRAAGQIKPTGERLYEKAIAVLAQGGKAEVTPTDVRKAAPKAGGTVGSYTYIVTQARKRGLIKGPINGLFTLTPKALSAVPETPPSRGITPKRKGGAPLSFREKIAAVKPKLPLSATLPGKVIGDVVKQGLTEVSQDQLVAALESAGGAIQSLYYVTVSLQHKGLLGARSSTGTYTVNTAEAERQLAVEATEE